MGAVAQFEKATTVAKLAAARKRDANGECEGRKSHAELGPDVVALARTLARKRPKGGKLSLRAISAALAAQGHLKEGGNATSPRAAAASDQHRDEYIRPEIFGPLAPDQQ